VGGLRGVAGGPWSDAIPAANAPSIIHSLTLWANLVGYRCIGELKVITSDHRLRQ